MRTFENLVQGGDIRKRSPIISVGTVKAGNNVDLGSVNTTPEEFRNEGFTLKAHEMFYDHTSETLRLRNLKTQQSPVISDLCLKKTRSGKSYNYILKPSRGSVLEKAPFSKCFSSTGKRKAGVFEFRRFEERISGTVGLTVRKKRVTRKH